ncbi:MAG: glycosyltransferase family 2 protein [Lutibacter sp.]|uniref:glycosyltransferase family 2 protein n=1 Tax=Lutibacter sp. TaxID=1925666 RepID=UPI00178DFD59|nr:glycosyltransferase family 2 protein [Lutibacter sp.]MBT8317434.1 glycosyltransferase family 2 protein [Lutibacter sp.]NNJ58293.1 glycosyltransferase family 2 protein [Lutibacter sp.]
MDISVIIVNYNVQYFLEQCILSVNAASRNLSVEIIVVDNSSTDASCSLLQRKYPEVVLIKNTKNVGFSKANNQGVAKASGEYILILNPDTVIPEDTFTQILKFSKSKQNMGALGVKLIDGSGVYLPESKRGIPTPMVAFNKLFGVSSKRTGKYYATHLAEDETGIVDILVGAFMFLKRSVYNEVKGFDEAYFMYGEDIDLSYKILNKGYQNYYFAEVQVIHYKGESTEKDVKHLKYFHKAMKIFYKKYFKLNLIYDFVMSFGIEFWFWLKFFRVLQIRQNLKQSFNVLYIGQNKLFENYLAKNHIAVSSNSSSDIIQIKQLIKASLIDTIIFDNEILSYKQIIALFQDLKNERLVFKIKPRTTNFLIGSQNSSKSGQIELVETS